MNNAKNLNQLVSGSSPLDNTRCSVEPLIYLLICISNIPKGNKLNLYFVGCIVLPGYYKADRCAPGFLGQYF